MSIDLRFLGQSGVRLQAGLHALYVDPYLSDSLRLKSEEPELWVRRFEPPLDADQIFDATVVLITHESPDHFDPETLSQLAAGSPHATFVVPRALVSATRDLVPNTTTVLAAIGSNDRYELGPFEVEAVPAAHAGDYRVEQSKTDGAHRWLGYVITADGLRVYHAGDTVRFDAQAAMVTANGPVDVVLLPINGRDAYREQRGITGNLWPREAGELAVELGAKILIPLHHDLFDFDGISPGELVDYVADRRLDLEVRLLTSGGSSHLAQVQRHVQRDFLRTM